MKDVIDKLIRKRIGITEGYDNWLPIAFANDFGEAGREYFRPVSSMHREYDRAKTDRKFDNSLKTNHGAVTIATFFHIALQKLKI